MNPPPVRNDRGHTFDLVMFDEAIDELLEKAPDVPMAAIATNATGKILHWNKFAELLYGWTADEVLGKNIADITVGPVQSEMASAVMESLAAGKAWTGGFTSRCKDGSYLDVIVLDAPVIDRDKQFVGIIGFSREDPEQFKAALDEVRSLRELGEHVDRVRNEVLRDLAARFKEISRQPCREFGGRFDRHCLTSSALLPPSNMLRARWQTKAWNQLMSTSTRRSIACRSPNKSCC